MIQQFDANEHWNDANGNPEGGVTSATGLAISWQRGPLGRGADRKPPNGTFVETVIAAAISRLEFYQNSRFACVENAGALNNLKMALSILNERTARREAAAVEGTHAGT